MRVPFSPSSTQCNKGEYGPKWRNRTKKKGKPAKACPFLPIQLKLDGYDVLGLRTFLALSYREFNLLAFSQSLES